MMHRAAIVVIILLLLAVCYIAGAEEETRFILCDPKPTNRVAVRRSPRKGAEETGWLECGDSILTDGKTKNGYLHILGITEYGEGWVHHGYVVNDKPIIERCNATVIGNGMVKARQNVGGKRISWLDICTDAKVYARSDEWSVTSRGYISTKFLEVWYGD